MKKRTKKKKEPTGHEENVYRGAYYFKAAFYARVQTEFQPTYKQCDLELDQLFGKFIREHKNKFTFIELIEQEVEQLS